MVLDDETYKDISSVMRINMLSLQEKADLENCITGDEVVPLLRDLFLQERYEDIIEAIDFHVRTQEINKGKRREYLHNRVISFINGIMIGKELPGYRTQTWEHFFKDKTDRKTWKDFILECLQNGKSSVFLSGIQTIKQSMQDFKKTH